MSGTSKTQAQVLAEFDALLADGQGQGDILVANFRQSMEDLIASVQWSPAGIAAQALAAGPSGVNNQFFPADAGFYNVTAYGAVGDGAEDANGNLLSGWTDNISALQTAFAAAVTAWLGGLTGAGPTLFFPGSTNPATPKIYVISTSLRWVTDGVGGTAWRSGVSIQGSGYWKLRFPDNTFLDATNSTPLLWVASQPSSPSNANGGGNAAFYNYLFDLVVDIGVGNPGASAVSGIWNNIGGVDNAVLMSSDPNHLGYAGIFDMNRYAPGPALLKRILFNGFSHGMINTQQDYSLTMSQATFVNQIVDTIENGPQMLSVEGVTDPAGLDITELDATGLVIDADRPSSHFTLPVLQMPAPAIITSSSSSDYLKITADNTGGTDATAAINAALASTTAKIAYLPFGQYKTIDSLIIPSTSTIRRFMGCGSQIVCDTTAFSRAASVTANFALTDTGFSAPGGTWNLSDKAAGIDLSGSNLIATGDAAITVGAYNSVRGTVGKSVGKFRYQFINSFNSHNRSGPGNSFIGLADSTFNLTAAAGPGVDFHSFQYEFATGLVYLNNAVLATLEAVPVGATVDFYVDFTGLLFWVRPSGYGASNTWNNDVIANQNPLTGTGGVSFAGMSGTLYPLWTTGYEGGGTTVRPMVQFSGTLDCLIDRLLLSPGPAAVTIEHNSAAQLSLRHIGAGLIACEGNYRNSVNGTGNLFIEDMSFASSFAAQGADMAILHPQNVWARQLNPETTGTKILNAGGKLWVLGLKTERPGTVIKTTTGGRTEVMGYFLYPLGGGDPVNPAFQHTDTATGSYAGVTEAYATLANDYATILQTPSKTILHSQLPGRGFGTRAPSGLVFG